MSCYWLALLLVWPAVASAELRLHVDKNRIGFVQAYLENAGDASLTVVTGNLRYQQQGDRVEIVPEQPVWSRSDGDVLLKGSLLTYAPVTLRPGEITFLQNPNIRVVAKEVVYTIPENWAALQGTWSGSTSVSLKLR